LLLENRRGIIGASVKIFAGVDRQVIQR
jgi:hypothetical protein